MKKLFALLIVSALIFSLAACGNSGKKDKSGSDEVSTTAETTQNEESTDATTTAQQNDDAVIESLKKELVGEWSFPGNGIVTEHLTFRDDGTGSYTGLGDKKLSFTYDLYLSHKTYNNGDPYTENMIKMTYDTGEVEDIIFFFNSYGKLAFHNSDNGGYSGVMDYTDAFTKE